MSSQPPANPSEGSGGQYPNWNHPGQQSSGQQQSGHDPSGQSNQPAGSHQGAQTPYTVDQQYAQNLYGQNQYDQNQQSGQQPYGQNQQSYGQNQQYGQQPYGQTPYANAQPGGPSGNPQYPSGYSTTYSNGRAFESPHHTSPWLGRAGLALVVVMGVALQVISLAVGRLMGQVFQRAGTTTTPDAQTIQTMYPEQWRGLVSYMTAGMAVGFLGLVGWVLCIVAASRRSSRGLAITGIIVGVLAVVLGFVMMVVGMVPYLPTNS